MLFSSNGFGIISPITNAFSTATPSTDMAVGQCSADGQFIWRAGPSGTASDGFWGRVNVGETCQTYSTVDVAVVSPTDTNPQLPSTTVHTPDTINVTPSKLIKVGPFTIPYEAKSFAIHWSTQLPKDWQDFINQELAHDCSGCVSSSMREATPGHPYGALRDFLGSGMPTQVNQDFLVRPTGNSNSFGQWYYTDCDTWDNCHARLFDPSTADLSGWNPIVFTQHPDTGEDFGIYMFMAPRDYTKPWDSTTNPYILNLYWRKVDRHWYESVWNWIKHIVAEVVEIATDVICNVACNPQALQTAMKSNPYAAVGGFIAMGTCKCPVPAVVAPIKPWYEQYWFIVIPVGAMVILGLLGKPNHREK